MPSTSAQALCHLWLTLAFLLVFTEAMLLRETVKASLPVLFLFSASIIFAAKTDLVAHQRKLKG